MTFLGYFIGHIPFVAHIVREYIDIILLAAVLVTVVPMALTYIRNARKAKKREHQAESTAVDPQL
ncbi:hypothetical protein QP157_19110 [Sphingomonas sp. LR61]|uniref:hypothetical protein n=1 Tax=Sphingomonas sp. LR61 TaxID=3050234 RepID=UPI002FE0C3D0